MQGDLDIVDGGDHDDRHVGILLFGTFQKGDAVHFRHHQVGEDQIKFFARFEQGHRLDAAGRMSGLEMGAREHGANDFPDGLFIVHHEDAIKGHAL